MAMREEDFGAVPAPAEGDGGLPLFAAAAPGDWRALCERAEARAERALARADAAEARCEDLLRAEREARSRAASLKSRLEVSREALNNAVEAAETARPAAKEVRDLTRENARLRKSLERTRERRDWLNREVRRLDRDNDRLHRELTRLPALGNKLLRLGDEIHALRETQADLRDRAARAGSLERRVWHLKMSLMSAADGKARLESELAERPLLPALARRLRARERTIASLRGAIARQRKTNGLLEARIAQLRSSRAVLSKAVFGGKSEKQETPRSERGRGQRRDAPGHGRTPRPALEEKEERQEPPPDALVCACCGKAYVANGERSASVIEIAVKAHIRRIVRPRYRRGCDCPSAPPEAIAPPPARLFPGTPYGTSVWARVLYERFACFRPLRRVAAWMTDQGLAIAPGTLAGSVRRFQPLFAPLAEAILAHQNGMAVRHGDETGWRIQALGEAGRSRRAWLWISVGKDAVYYRIDPSRSAEAAMKLFGSVKDTVFLVCDRYVAYVKMARELDGKVILCWCWIHQRRDFIECAAGQVKLRQWCEAWIERFASVFRLNKERLKHYDPALDHQTPAFDAAQAPLKKAVEDLFAQGEAELADLPDKARQGKALRSLLKHREGLSVFVDNPQVPMDNNVAEREFRKAVIGRRLCFGSDSEDGAGLTSTMYSVFGTLAMNGIDVPRWLEAWLEACANNGGQPPDDLSPWLPWTMTEERRREFMTPE